jgi:hypothetical protein
MDLKVQSIDEIAPYSGPNSIPGMRFRPAARALGVTAWGMNVIEIDAGCEKYPEHDHQKDGQEEVYVVLRGSATLHTDRPVRGRAGLDGARGPIAEAQVHPGAAGRDAPRTWRDAGEGLLALEAFCLVETPIEDPRRGRTRGQPAR